VSDWPDLIQAYATNGNLGYVRRDELKAADGGNAKSPAEAVAWMKILIARAAAGTPVTIPVYTLDGKTVIGKFAILPANPNGQTQVQGPTK
jgi:hypothetical protein